MSKRTCAGAWLAYRAGEEGPRCPNCDSVNINLIEPSYDGDGIDEPGRIECEDCTEAQDEEGGR